MREYLHSNLFKFEFKLSGVEEEAEGGFRVEGTFLCDKISGGFALLVQFSAVRERCIVEHQPTQRYVCFAHRVHQTLDVVEDVFITKHSLLQKLLQRRNQLLQLKQETGLFNVVA